LKIKVHIHRPKRGILGRGASLTRLCVEGDSFEEVLANIREAAEGWVELAVARTQSILKLKLLRLSFEIGFLGKRLCKVSGGERLGVYNESRQPPHLCPAR